MTKLTHDDLIKVGTLLGYNAFTKGLCYGFSCMWAQALLAQDEERFFKRLELIASYNPHFEALITDYEEAKKKARQLSQLNQKENDLLEIPAFFDGIEMYFNPERHSDVLDREYLYQSDINIIYPFIQSKKMEHSELSILFNKSHIYSKASLTAFLQDLEEELKETDSELPILLSNAGHSVCFNYSKTKQKWFYIDTNDFSRYTGSATYYRELETTKLVSSLFESLSDSSAANVLFNMRVLSTSNQNQLDSIKASLALLNSNYPFTGELATAYDGRELGLIFLACQQGDLNLVKKLLDHNNIDINQAHSDGTTPLLIACQNGHFAVITELLKHPKIKINQAKNNGVTPLYTACQYNHLTVVELLLNPPGIDINSRGLANHTPLLVACLSPYTQDNEKLFQLLLNKGAGLGHKNAKGQTALDIAFEQNNTAALSVLLKAIPLQPMPPSALMSSSSLAKALCWAKVQCPEVADYLTTYQSLEHRIKFFTEPAKIESLNDESFSPVMAGSSTEFTSD